MPIKDVSRGKIPCHIAIIMDGNGRWAEEKGLPRIEGHRRGAQVVKEVVTNCTKIDGLKYLTLYTFSRDNWKRPKREVTFLMRLLVQFLQQERSTILDNNVRVLHLGELGELPEFAQEELETIMKKSANNSGLVLSLAINYGGRHEISQAAKQIATAVKKGTVNPEDVDENLFARFLYTRGMPDPDLIIRTGGEFRLSDFLLWQASYAEFWSTKVYWPDFNKKTLMQAIHDYSKRDRKFGRVKEG